MRRVARRLHTDRSGQILVFLVFASVILLGFVVVVVAIGQRVLDRRQLQDAVDAGAFGAAAIRARAFNLLALGNLLMAALLAVAIALELVADVLTIVAGALSGICASSWLTGQVWACGLVPTAWQLQRDFSELRDRARPQLIRAARSIPAFQDAVRDAAPLWANAEAIAVARENVPDAQVTVLPLPATRLPVRRGRFEVLCDHALGMVVEPIRRLAPQVIFSRVAGWVNRMLDGFRSHYCGSGEGGGRARTIRYDKGIPERPDHPPTPGAGCRECAVHRRVRRFYLTRVDESWKVTRRPGGPATTSAPSRAPPRHVEKVRLPCRVQCERRPHCEEKRVGLTHDNVQLVEKHARIEWTLDACLVEERKVVDGGEPLPSDLRPVALDDDWARQGHNQTRAFVKEGPESAGRRPRLDGWRRKKRTNAPSRAAAVAQAEFWSRSGGGLWALDWRARLRRFRLPRKLPTPVGRGLPTKELLEERLLH